MNNQIATDIEAVLFFKNEPVKRSWLAKTLKRTDAEVSEGIDELKNRLSGHGIVLVENGDEVALRSAPAQSELLEGIRKEELSRDLGKAGLETLSIILYRGPVTRAEVDYIRGVNSTFIIRSMLVRGLVEKIPNPKDARGFLYQPTFELLSYLGVSKVNELPEYDAVREEIAQFETKKEAEAEKETPAA